MYIFKHGCTRGQNGEIVQYGRIEGDIFKNSLNKWARID